MSASGASISGAPGIFTMPGGPLAQRTRSQAADPEPETVAAPFFHFAKLTRDEAQRLIEAGQELQEKRELDRQRQDEAEQRAALQESREGESEEPGARAALLRDSDDPKASQAPASPGGAEATGKPEVRTQPVPPEDRAPDPQPSRAEHIDVVA